MQSRAARCPVEPPRRRRCGRPSAPAAELLDGYSDHMTHAERSEQLKEIQSAVKRTGYADFWELYRRNVLPKETRNYVPIIVAVTIMAKNPAIRTRFGGEGKAGSL